MVGTAIEYASMDIGARSPGNAVKEVMDEFSLQISHKALSHLGIHHGRSAPAKIERGQSQSLVQRGEKSIGVRLPASRDAHTSVAAPVRRPVANQNAACFHAPYEFRMKGSDARQHEICLARPEGNSNSAEVFLQPTTARLH